MSMGTDAGTTAGSSGQGGQSEALAGARLMALLGAHNVTERAPTSLPPPNLPSFEQHAVDLSSSGSRAPDLSTNTTGPSNVTTSTVTPPPPLVPALPSAPLLSSVRDMPGELDNLQAELTSRKSASRRDGKGRVLTGEYVVYDVDVRLPGEEQPQLEVTPITVYNSDPESSPGHRIAVNLRYICYLLRQGSVRILSVGSGARAVLKGHKERVIDMAFFGKDVNLYASVCVQGQLIIREISETADQDGRPQIREDVLLAFHLQGPWGEETVAPQLCWHPTSQDVLFVACHGYLLRISIGKARALCPPMGIARFFPFSVDSPPPGVTVFRGHDGPIISLSRPLSSDFVLATPSKDGTVRFWSDDPNRGCLSVLVPHDGQPVYSAAFMQAPPGFPRQTILLTGGPENREIKLWVSACPGTSIPPPNQGWLCIQTLDFRASRSRAGEGKDAFYNLINVVDDESLILVANPDRLAIYAVHVSFGLSPQLPRMDYLAEFSVTMPIFSFSVDLLNQKVVVSCVQSQGIQQYTLEVVNCLPPEEEKTDDIEPLKVEQLSSDSNHDTRVELGTLLGLVNGSAAPFGSPVDRRLSTHSSPSRVEVVTSSPSSLSPADVVGMAPSTAGQSMEPCQEVTVSSEEEQRLEPDPAETAPLLQELTDVPPKAETLVGSFPTESSKEKEGPDSAADPKEAALPDTTPGCKAEGIDAVGGLLERQGPPKMQLVTPMQIMSLVASTEGKGSPVLESNPSLPKNQILETGRHEAIDGADFLPGEPLENVPVSGVQAADTREVPQEVPPKAFTELLENRGGHVDTTKGAVGGSPAESPADLDLSVSVAESTEVSKTVAAQSSGEAKVAEEGAGMSPASSGSFASGLAVKGRKNKNKSMAVAGPSLPTLPPPQSVVASTSQGLPALTVIADTEGAQSFDTEASSRGPSGGDGLRNVPLAAVQESINQLMSMQRDLSNKVAMLVAVPVAKEGKRIEAALGSRLEKTLKAHADAQWARLQDDAARREKGERDRLQQIASAVARELQPALEKSLKKEVSSLAPAVARLVLPPLETAIGSATSELQKLGPQIESSVATQVESAVRNQIATEFQTTVRTTIQESFRSCLQAAVLPAFESVCKNMFEQMDATLKRGLSEHSSAAQQKLTASHTALASSLQDSMLAASALTTSLKEEMMEGQRKLITLAETAAANSKANQAAGKANGSLPERVLSLQHVEESLDPTRELTRLLGERKYEAAFTKALSLADVALVAWLCSQVEPTVLFSGGSSNLSQGVLLSLVHQLSFDMGVDSERKLLWLRHVALSLNPADPQLANHMRPILEQVYQNLHRHLPQVTDALAADLRLVIHLINSLLTACK